MSATRLLDIIRHGEVSFKHASQDPPSSPANTSTKILCHSPQQTNHIQKDPVITNDTACLRVSRHSHWLPSACLLLYTTG